HGEPHAADPRCRVRLRDGGGNVRRAARRVGRVRRSSYHLGAGCWLLVVGCWLLGAGCWGLAAFCSVRRRPRREASPRDSLEPLRGAYAPSNSGGGGVPPR